MIKEINRLEAIGSALSVTWEAMRVALGHPEARLWERLRVAGGVLRVAAEEGVGVVWESLRRTHGRP